MGELILTASITVDKKEYSVAFDLSPNGIKGPLTEEKFEECYMFLKPSLAKVLRDHNKIVNPWG